MQIWIFAFAVIAIFLIALTRFKTVRSRRWY
jgi:hypothetical protein